MPAVMRPPVTRTLLRSVALGALLTLTACAAEPTPAKPQRTAAKVDKPRPAPKAKAPVADDTPDLVTYGRRDDVMRFADEVAARHGLDAGWTRDALERARMVPDVARYIMPPPAGTAKNWAAYRARFVEPVRIRAGAAFWRAQREWLARAEATYGVPPEIIVGIVGIETLYGQQMGGFRVVDALATLAFDFPAGRKDRSGFFRDELESFFVMCDAERIEPLAIRGSYAGAMGMPQFMPSSVVKYAVDFDADGRIDLHRDAADVIGSVAHYLAEFGWQRGLPTRFGVAVPVDAVDRATLLAPDIVPTFTPAEFARRGARLAPQAQALEERADGDPAGPVGAAALAPKLALVELQNGDAAPSYVAGTANFYAITRYNWSSYYALAVIELGEAVARAIAASDPAPLKSVR